MSGFIYNLVDTHASNYRLAAEYKGDFIKEWIDNGENILSLFERFFNELERRIIEDKIDLNQVNSMCTYNICQFMAVCISKGVREEDINNELLKNYYDFDNSLNDVKMLEELKKICLKMIDATKNNRKVIPSSKAVSECVKYIEDNIVSSLTLDRISKALNYSSDYISHKFNSEMNMGVNEYISSRKIEYAKTKLSNGKSVNDVANELSYSSSSYFIKSFKRKTGLSPKQYQKWVMSFR